MGALVEAFATVPEGLPPDERAVEIGVAYLAFARTHPEDVDLIAVNEAAIHAQPSSPQHERLEEVVIGVMRDGAQTGVFRLPVEEAEYAAFGAWAFVQGLASFERQQGSELAVKLRPQAEAVARRLRQWTQDRLAGVCRPAGGLIGRIRWQAIS